MRDPAKPKRKYVRRKTQLPSERTLEQIERRIEEEAREAAWEIMMTERIENMTAIIREENDELKRIFGGERSDVARQPKSHKDHSRFYPRGIR